MENWIGIGAWIVLGAAVGMSMKVLVRLPSPRPGHTLLLGVLGAFAAVVGGMLGVGLFEFSEPRALSTGGMIGALFLSVLLTWTYRWGSKSLI
jgi:zinc transporter ZupT